MKKTLFLLMILFLVLLAAVQRNALCAGASSASSDTRGRYLAGRGIIIPPEEIFLDSYLASVDYNYPKPGGDLGINIYNSSSIMKPGQEGILQIGIQGRKANYAELPPMNLVFVVDCSDSMNDENKIEWVRESAAIFVTKVRPQDSLALVSFTDTAEINFPSSLMNSSAKKQNFLDAIGNLQPHGTSNPEKGLAAGYQQALLNYREGSVNRVLFFSDGTEFSSRLNLAGAKSGDIRVSLIWNNRNDLDLHVFTPKGEEIYYGHKKDTTGGMLDVDMNVTGETTKPVENIFWGQGRAAQGRYRVVVRNYGYHEKSTEPTPFQIEIKNGYQYSYFDGIVNGKGRDSDAEVTSFDFMTASALKEEKDIIYQLAASYRELGITISTIGVGVGFDAELMQTLAQDGGGSSRFINDRAEMKKLFDTEFERMAVLAATDLDMVLEFMPGVEVLETWGYQNQIEQNPVNGSKIYYTLAGLHSGDYETILVRYCLPLNAELSVNRFADFTVNSKNLFGKTNAPQTKTAEVTVSENTADGISSGMVLRSGTILNFTEAIKEIGSLYYACQDDLTALSILEQETGNQKPDPMRRQRINELMENILKRLEASLNLERKTRLEMEDAAIRLDNPEIFKNQTDILVKYDEILSRELIASGGSPAGKYYGLDNPADNTALNMANTANTVLLGERLSALCSEISSSFPAGGRYVTALAPFGIRGTEEESPLLEFIYENAIVNFSKNPGITLVERSRLDVVRTELNLNSNNLSDTDTAIETGKLLGAGYIITGQVIPISGQVIIFARVIQVETGEILSAAQIFVDRAITEQIFP
ncbi:MAG: VWA domain-containing protein [Treponema sp.]|nr:VWA domain-containing protein [Treponema sp.]